MKDDRNKFKEVLGFDSFLNKAETKKEENGCQQIKFGSFHEIFLPSSKKSFFFL